MALVFGHSQVKYLHEYVDSDKIVTLCFSGYTIPDLMDLDSVFEIVASMSVSMHFLPCNIKKSATLIKTIGLLVFFIIIKFTY